MVEFAGAPITTILTDLVDSTTLMQRVGDKHLGAISRSPDSITPPAADSGNT